MNPESLESMIEAARLKIQALAERTDAGPEQRELLTEALDELSTAIQELSAASEELNAQNDELFATRDIVEAERHRYMDLFESAPCAYVVTDSHGVIREANGAAAALLAAPLAALIGKPLSVFVADDDLRAFRAELLALRAEKAPRTREFCLKPRRGEALDVVATVAPVRDAQGQVADLRWMIRRFTQRAEFESRMHTINALLKLFAGHATQKEYFHAVARLLRDLCGCRCAGIRIRNERNEIPYEAAVGFTPGFLQSESCLLLERDRCACTRVIGGQYTPQDASATTPGGSFCLNDVAAFLKILSEEDRAAFRTTCLEAGFASVAVIPIRHRGEVVGAIHLADGRTGTFAPRLIEFIEQMAPLIGEASHRFEVEERLRRNEARLEAFFKGSITPVVLLDKSFNFIRVNQAYADACRRDISEFAGRNHFDFYPSDARAIFEQVVQTKKPAQVVGRPFIFPDQPQRGITYWDWTLVPILDERGEVDFLAFTLRDVTDRTRAEQELRRAGQLNERIFSTPYVKIAYMDTRFTYLRVNAAFAELYGREPNMLVGRNHVECNPDEAMLMALRRVVETGQPYFARAQQLRLGNKDAHDPEPTYWDWTVTPMHDTFANVDGVLLMLVDVTQQKQAEQRQAALREQFEQAQKLDIIGRMAAGLAHDFSNLLTGVSGYVNLANETVRQAQGITDSLMTLAGQGKLEKAPLDLRELVDRTVRLLRHTMPQSIELETRLCETPVWVNGNAVQLEQVLTNLARNARDAMAKGGTLRIRLDRKTARQLDRAASGTRADEAFAVLTIQDTGEGVLPELMPHIFEPFFTTKPRGQGAGLGLPLVDAIVKDHAGRITVESKPGKGSTFVVVLPSVAPQVSAQEADTRAEPTADIPHRPGELILLAESDPHVRGVVAMTLQPLGYQVTQVNDGGALLASLHPEHGTVRLIILGEDLPERTGLDCLREIRAHDAQTPVILMTRNNNPDVDAQFGHEAMIVRKPFQLPTFRQAVRKILGV
jgi:PAS domain S-box-containing protein